MKHPSHLRASLDIGNLTCTPNTRLIANQWQRSGPSLNAPISDGIKQLSLKFSLNNPPSSSTPPPHLGNIPVAEFDSHIHSFNKLPNLNDIGIKITSTSVIFK